jgi:DNA polymerase-3 subunit delta
MIVVFYGKDDFSSHEALDELRRELDSDGMLADNTVRLDANARPDELLAFCQTVPFLSSHRLIVVDRLLAKFENSGGRRRRKTPDDALEQWQPFIEALPSLPETTALVFMEGDLSASNAFLQALKPHAKAREFKPLAQSDVAPWIVERAQRHGIALEARAVAALAQLVGNQLWTLDSELRKLATYADGRPVSEDDVRALVSLAREPSVFAMADAVIEGRLQDAEELLQRLLAEGEPAQRLLAMVARQYRLLLLTKELLDKRVRGPEISARLQVQGFVVQRLLKQAPAYTIDSLRQAYGKLIEADLSVKRGVYDDETALQLLFFELASLARPGATPRGGRPGYSRPPAGRAPARRGAARGSSGTS